MAGPFEGFDKSINEGVEGISAALMMSVFGTIISAFSTLPGGDAVVQYWVFFLALMALADGIMVLGVAQEALGASIGYIIGRALGLWLMIYMGRIIGISMSPYMISFLILLAIVVIKAIWMAQEAKW